MYKRLSKKAGYLLAVAGAAVVGGASTVAVIAAVPDQNGDIQACYASSASGALRVVDSSADCVSGETSLSWAQQQVAYSHINFSYDTYTASVDTNRSHGIVAFAEVPEGYCLQVGFTPHVVLGQLLGETKIGSTWSGPNGTACDGVTGANVYVPAANAALDISVQ